MVHTNIRNRIQEYTVFWNIYRASTAYSVRIPITSMTTGTWCFHNMFSATHPHSGNSLLILIITNNLSSCMGHCTHNYDTLLIIHILILYYSKLLNFKWINHHRRTGMYTCVCILMFVCVCLCVCSYVCMFVYVVCVCVCCMCVCLRVHARMRACVVCVCVGWYKLET